MADEYVSLREAQEILRVSRTKIWSLVRDGVLKTYDDPLDKRKKLIKLEDLDKLTQPVPRSGT